MPQGIGANPHRSEELGCREPNSRNQREARMADVINFSGAVEWSGENPGISLERGRRRAVRRAGELLSRRALPHGRGHALVLLQSPQTAGAPGNVCLTDNEKLARYLVSDFVSHFGACEGSAGLTNLPYRALDSVEASGDPASTYHETVKAGDLTAKLTWSGLSAPFCFALPPDKSATGQASHAEPVRAMRQRDDHGERQAACPASRCRARWRGTSLRPRCSRSRRRGFRGDATRHTSP